MAARFRGGPGHSGNGGNGVQPPPPPQIQPQGQQVARRPGSEGYDGPSEPRQNPFGSGLGYDPAKPVVKESVITNRRVELPPDAYRLDVSLFCCDFDVHLHDGLIFQIVKVFPIEVVSSKAC